MQFSTVAASTCLVRRSASISLVGFLPSGTSPSVTIACTGTLCRCVSLWSEPSSAPNRNSSCGVHPHTSFEFPSPRYRNHQTITLRFAGAERNHACPLQYVQTVLSPSSSAQPEALFLVRMQLAWSVSHQDSMPLEQPDQPRTHSDKTS